MCGIVGYVGQQQAAPLLLDGLCRLEYRGYDSAGIAVCSGDTLQVRKTPGRLAALETLTHGGADLPGTVGIGHTRWATHGEPNQVNAHPQVSGDGKFAVVHNGIIENFARLKQELIQKGCTFVSETDTEVVAQLLAWYYSQCGDLASHRPENIGKPPGGQLRRLHRYGNRAPGNILIYQPSSPPLW